MLHSQDERRLPGGLLIAACVAAAATAAYRFAAFNGFPNDQYMHLAWAQEVTRGAWPGLDFVEPGMPLTIALSAAAQLVGGRGIVPELLLCVAMLAVTSAVTCWLAGSFSGSVTMGLAAAALQAAIYPRLYNYPKFLVPVVAVALLWRYLDRPTTGRAAVIGAWMTAGFLFRHDYLLYVGLGTAAAFALRATTLGARPALVHAAACAGTATGLVLPYLLALTMLGGLGTHVSDAMEYFQGEGNQWTFPTPTFTRSSPTGDASLFAQVVTRENATVALYYGIAVLTLGLLAWSIAGLLRRKPRRVSTPEAQAAVLALVTLSLALIVVRHPIDDRLVDAGGVMPLVLVVAMSVLPRWTGVRRLAVPATVAAALSTVIVHGEMRARLEDADAFKGPRPFVRRSVELWRKLQRPPWEAYWPAGDFPRFIGYLRSCTADTDHVMVTWFAPEIFTFADRGFGAGHAIYIRRSFFAVNHQRRMITWLDREHAPVALINVDQEWFKARLPLVQYYLDEHYRIIGMEQVRDQSIAVAIRRDAHPAGVYADTGWPCFR